MIETRKANANEFSYETELSSKVLSGRQAMQTNSHCPQSALGTLGVCFYPQLKRIPRGTGRSYRMRKTRNRGIQGSVS